MLGTRPYFDIRHSWDGRAVSSTRQSHFTPKEIPWYSCLLEADWTLELLIVGRRNKSLENIRMEEVRLPKEVTKWRKRGRPKLTWAEGIRVLMGEKGLMEEDWNDRGNWRKKINIIVKWAQGDVETLYNLLNNNNKIFEGPHRQSHPEPPMLWHSASTKWLNCLYNSPVASILRGAISFCFYIDCPRLQVSKCSRT